MNINYYELFHKRKILFLGYEESLYLEPHDVYHPPESNYR